MSLVTGDNRSTISVSVGHVQGGDTWVRHSDKCLPGQGDTSGTGRQKGKLWESLEEGHTQIGNYTLIHTNNS